MNTQEKITLMIMRDNGDTRRMRLRRRSFYFFVVICCILPFATIGSLWFAGTTWYTLHNLIVHNEHLEREYQKNLVQVARLSHMEALVERRNIAENTVIMRNLQLDTDVKGDTPPAPPPQGPEGVIGPGHEEVPIINTGFVNIENVQARTQPGNKIRISLDIINAMSQKNIAGKVRCMLTTANGETIALKFNPENAGDFRISRLKRVALVSSLPEDITPHNAQFVMEVHSDKGELVYRNVFAVTM